jgi:ParB/RepB/Spo0J family partition protein
MDQTEMFALVESMRAVGQLQAILVKPRGDRYEVVAGHRRLRAAIYLRWPTINATIMEGTQDDYDAAKSHENAFREQIKPEDEGHYFEYLARDKKMGIKEISRFCNRSHYYVESRLACITWPADIRDALRNDIIGLGAAEALAEVTEDAERQRLLGYASTNGVSARTARGWADAWLITKQAVDVETMRAAQSQISQKWEEPMFPCYGCERPQPISQLHVIRLCGGCHADLSTAQTGSRKNLNDSKRREQPATDTPPPPETGMQPENNRLEEPGKRMVELPAANQ